MLTDNPSILLFYCLPFLLPFSFLCFFSFYLTCQLSFPQIPSYLSIFPLFVILMLLFYHSPFSFLHSSSFPFSFCSHIIVLTLPFLIITNINITSFLHLPPPFVFSHSLSISIIIFVSSPPPYPFSFVSPFHFFQTLFLFICLLFPSLSHFLSASPLFFLLS